MPECRVGSAARQSCAAAPPTANVPPPPYRPQACAARLYPSVHGMRCCQTVSCCRRSAAARPVHVHPAATARGVHHRGMAAPTAAAEQGPSQGVVHHGARLLHHEAVVLAAVALEAAAARPVCCKLLPDHCTGKLHCSQTTADGDLTFMCHGIHLGTVTDLDGHLGVLQSQEVCVCVVGVHVWVCVWVIWCVCVHVWYVWVGVHVWVIV